MISNDKIKSLRLQHGWSQEQLASITGLSARTIQRIEKTGDCSLESQMALASAFSITHHELTVDFSKKLNKSGLNKSGIFYLITFILIIFLIYQLGGSLQILIHTNIVSIFILTFLCMSFMANGVRNTFIIFPILKRFITGSNKLDSPLLKTQILRRQIIHSYSSGVVACLLSSLILFIHTSTIQDIYISLTLHVVISQLYAVVISELIFRPVKHRLEEELLSK